MALEMGGPFGDDLCHENMEQILQDAYELIYPCDFLGELDTSGVQGYQREEIQGCPDQYRCCSESSSPSSDTDERSLSDPTDLFPGQPGLYSPQEPPYETTAFSFCDIDEIKINQIKENLPGYPLGAQQASPEVETCGGALAGEAADYPDIPSPVLNHSWPRQVPARRKRVRRCYKLWQFILDLLRDEDKNYDLVRWLDRKSGVFTFIQSQEVASLWGKKKNKATMTYEHLARAIRHYYKQQVMRRIPGRRLVYQFGPSAQGWQEVATGNA